MNDEAIYDEYNYNLRSREDRDNFKQYLDKLSSDMDKILKKLEEMEE